MTGKSGIFQKLWRINLFTHSFWNICDGKNFSLTDISKTMSGKNWFFILFEESHSFQSLSWIIWKQMHFISYQKYSNFINGHFYKNKFGRQKIANLLKKLHLEKNTLKYTQSCYSGWVCRVVERSATTQSCFSGFETERQLILRSLARVFSRTLGSNQTSHSLETKRRRPQ